MKLTKKQLKVIASQTPADMIGKQVSICDSLGYYSRPDWNWGYRAGFTSDGVPVVTCFGDVCGPDRF